MYSDERRRESKRNPEREKVRAREHPLRRALLQLLSVGGGKRELPATALCHELSDSPALSVVVYHLKVLLDAGLVETSGDDPSALVYSRSSFAFSAKSGQ